MARIRKHLKIAKVKTKMGHPIIFCYQHRVLAFSGNPCPLCFVFVACSPFDDVDTGWMASLAITPAPPPIFQPTKRARTRLTSFQTACMVVKYDGGGWMSNENFHCCLLGKLTLSTRHFLLHLER